MVNCTRFWYEICVKCSKFKTPPGLVPSRAAQKNKRANKKCLGNQGILILSVTLQCGQVNGTPQTAKVLDV